jgi:hypothetical protein
MFGAPAIIIASPWLIKNLFWTGNPIFPFFFSSTGLNPAELSLWFTYVQSYGIGKEWYNYLLLPISLYTEQGRFGTWFGFISPSPFFLFAFAYPFLRKNQKFSIPIQFDYLAWITLFMFVFWVFGSQQTRFLFPIYPGLCLISSIFLIYIARSIKRNNLGRSIIFASVTGVVISSMVVIYVALLSSNPINLFVGTETKREFLSRTTRDYPAFEYIKKHLPQSAKVLMILDGRGYYCDNRCLPDIDQARWTTMVQEAPTIGKMINLLREKNITHILYNHEDVNFFLNGHDPTGKIRTAVDFFMNEFRPACLRNIYKDELVEIFEINVTLLSCQ